MRTRGRASTRCAPRCRTRRCAPGTRTNGVVGMGVTPDSIVELWIRTLAKHGIESLWIFDCLHDVDKMLDVAPRSRATPAWRRRRRSTSPLPGPHRRVLRGRDRAAVAGRRRARDDHPRRRGRRARPERARRWIRPDARPRAGGVPLEMHFHNRTAMGTSTTSSASRRGSTILHTAVSTWPTASRCPRPRWRRQHAPARPRGRDRRQPPGRGLRALRRRWPSSYGHHLGAPVEYSLATVQQQFPGGMTGTLRNQLRDLRHGGPAAGGARGGRSGSAPRWATRSWPRRSPSWSGIQALLNVVKGERYLDDPRREPDVPRRPATGRRRARSTPELLDQAFSADRGGKQMEGGRRRSHRWRRSARSTARTSPTRSCCCAT